MEFLIILIAWALLRWRRPGAAPQRDQWLWAWYLRAGAVLAMLPAAARLLLVCALPALLVAVIAWLLTPWLGGVLLFAFALSVLLYSLGRGDIRAELDAYLERWQRGDLEAAYREAQVMGLDTVPVDDGAELHAQVRRTALYLALERWFAVVFWFYLLGPGGALFYHILQWSRRNRRNDAEQQLLRRWLEWLDWLPARLLGLAFAVAGNFAGCFRVWRANLLTSPPVRALLVLYEQEALAGVATSGEKPQFIEQAAVELRELAALLDRCAISWLVLFALLQLVR
jgi:AmpE protein